MDVNGAKKLATKLLMNDVGKKRGLSVVTKQAMVSSLHNLFKGSGRLHADVPEGELTDMVKWRFALTVVVQDLEGLPGMKTDWFEQFESRAKVVLAQKATPRD